MPRTSRQPVPLRTAAVLAGAAAAGGLIGGASGGLGPDDVALALALDVAGLVFVFSVLDFQSQVPTAPTTRQLGLRLLVAAVGIAAWYVGVGLVVGVSSPAAARPTALGAAGYAVAGMFVVLLNWVLARRRARRRSATGSSPPDAVA